MIATVWRRLRRDESGITLIELLIAMVLLGIFLAIVANLYVSSLKVVSLGRELSGNTKVASTAMNEASRVIRAGTENPKTPPAEADPAFVIANKDDLVMYAFINLSNSAEQPQMFRLRVDRTTGKLIESRWPAVALSNGRWQFPANPCSAPSVPVGCTAPAATSVIAETISPQGSNAPVFTYLDNEGNVLTPTSTGLTLANRKLVAAVRVRISVQTSLTDDSNPVILENTVGIPNLGFAQEAPG